MVEGERNWKYRLVADNLILAAKDVVHGGYIIARYARSTIYTRYTTAMLVVQGGITPEFSLSRGALQIIAIACSTPGMVEITDDLIRAGSIADSAQEKLGVPPTDPVAQKAWLDEEVDLQVTERGRGTLRKVMETAAKKGMLGAGRRVTDALNVAGFTADL